MMYSDPPPCNDLCWAEVETYRDTTIGTGIEIKNYSDEWRSFIVLVKRVHADGTPNPSWHYRKPLTIKPHTARAYNLQWHNAISMYLGFETTTGEILGFTQSVKP